MQRYRWKGTFEAVQWFKVGDHPAVTKASDSKDPCVFCGKPLCEHGRIVLNGVPKLVCPGKWIVRFEGGTKIMGNDAFREQIEPVPETPDMPLVDPDEFEIPTEAQREKRTERERIRRRMRSNAKGGE